MKKISAYLRILGSTAFAPGTAGWKLDADGKIEAKDGNPVWVEADGSEKVMGGDAIARVNNEAKQHRETAATAIANLKKYEVDGKLLDPAQAIKALDTLAKIDQKTLIDAGKVDEVKNQITAQFTAQLTEKDNALKDLQSKFDNSQINSIFAGSDFIRDRIAVPRDMFEATFRNNFKIEDGKPVAYDKAGNRLMSKTKIGEFADHTEALELLVEAHPQKDVILKADAGNGTGSNGNGGNRAGGNRITKAAFDAMTPVQKNEVAIRAGAGELTIVDN